MGIEDTATPVLRSGFCRGIGTVSPWAVKTMANVQQAIAKRRSHIMPYRPVLAELARRG
jgi:hypothetical protein